MGKGLAYQQQCYGDNGMWMDAQAQQQSYAFHEESWGADNGHYKQFPGMHMMPGGGAFASMEHELSMSKHHGHGMLGGPSRPDYVHGGGKMHGFGGTNAPHHMFSNSGVKFNHGGGGGHNHGYYSEESEDEAYNEEHHGGGTMKMDEMRYERHNNWGHGDGYYSNPYDVRMNRNHMNMNMNWKPHRGGHKAEWTPKGV